MGITLSNIENYLYLFQDKNDDFKLKLWAEPIYAAMIRAYQNDEKTSVYIGNDYIRTMIETEYTKNKTYSPIERISDRNGLDAISNHLSSIMIQNFESLSDSDKKDLKNYIQYLFIELMNNVADHSHSSVGGYAMAQYFPTGKKIQFVVADRGIGFLENMQLNFASVSTEEQAIFKALEKGITSTRQKMYGKEKNAGYGLYAMFEILKMTGGKFVIISNDTLVRYETGDFTVVPLEHNWKGVVVSFEFDETQINYNMDYFNKTYLWNDLEEEEDFF